MLEYSWTLGPLLLYLELRLTVPAGYNGDLGVRSVTNRTDPPSLFPLPGDVWDVRAILVR